MVHSKIIYGDGTTERRAFQGGEQAIAYAQQEARRNNTIVRSQSVVRWPRETPARKRASALYY